MAEHTIDTLSINIVSDSQKATKKIDLLIGKLETLNSRLSQTQTNGLRNFNNQLNNIASKKGNIGSGGGVNSKSVSSIRSYNTAVKNATKSTKGLASQIGKFYATYFLIIRGSKKFADSIRSAADYYEAFNYSNVTFGKVAQEWSYQWEKYGYENAEAYADSFSSRMDSVISKMSGQTLNKSTGLIERTGKQNLGLDITELTQYSANLMALTNSLGFTGEASYSTAEAFSKLAGDLSSLKNIDLEQVMQNLTSGLSGQTLVMRKYGIDISVARMQEELFAMGIDRTVNSLTQAEKAQLRMLMIIKGGQVAWGDLSNSINSTSNQLRSLKANFSNLGRSIASLFIPLASRVIPVMNGIVMAIQNVIVWIGNLFGIQIDLSQFSAGYDDSVEGLDDLADAYDNATSSANKYNKQLRAWDERNNINSKDSSGNASGVGGEGLDLTEAMMKALENYNSVWDKAFNNMKNKAVEIAEIVNKYLRPFKDMIEDIAKSIKNNFAPAFEKLGGTFGSGLVAGLYDFVVLGSKGVVTIIEGIGAAFKMLIDFIPEGILKALGFAIGSFSGYLATFLTLLGVEKIIMAVASSMATLLGVFTAHPIVAISAGVVTLIGAIAMLSDVSTDPLRNVTEETRQMIENLDFALQRIETINKKLSSDLNSVAIDKRSIEKISEAYLKLSEVNDPTDAQVVLLKQYRDQLEGYCGDITDYVDEITGAWKGTSDEMQKLIDKSAEYYKQQAYSNYLVSAYKVEAEIEIEIEKMEVEKTSYNQSLDKFKEDIKKLTGKELRETSNYTTQVETLVTNMSNLTAQQRKEWIETARTMDTYKKSISTLDGYISDSTVKLDNQKKEVVAIENAYNNLSTTTDNNTNSVNKNKEAVNGNKEAVEAISKVIDIFKDKSKTSADSVSNDNSKSSNSFTQFKNSVKNNLDTAITVLNNFASTSKEKGAEAGNNTVVAYDGNVNKIGTVANKYFEEIQNNASAYGSKAGADMGNGLVNNVSTVIENQKPTLISKIQSIFSSMSVNIPVDVVADASQAATSIAGSISQMASKAKSVIPIKKYASGGYPTQGSLFIANEAGAELVGTMNGRTTVAPNQEITGISDSVYVIGANIVNTLNATNNLLAEVRDKTGITSGQVFKAVKKEATDYMNRTGSPAF